ncbi:G-protein coupled receptor 84 [Latimeria chalumnae]|nr:PREDICTED: G-protein coupled receptor 84 [Latimeria chalumnae]|eukprot:XP_005995665.1 PREDICTED: G-protein coupled receptor 84 [Latimeria chalumnae]
MNFTDDNYTCYSPGIVHYRYFAASWGIMVTLVGTIGNVLTILAFALDKKLQTRFNLLIINLTLADILYCSLLQPFSVDAYVHLYWRAGDTFCQVFGLLLFVANSVSILTLCLIAVSRYLLIANSKVFNRIFSRFNMPFIIGATWVAGFGSFGPLWYAFVFVKKVCTCSFHRIKGRPYTTILMAFYFVVGLGTVGVFYFLIHRKVKAAAKALQQYKIKTVVPKEAKSDGIDKSTPGRYEKFEDADSGISAGVSHTQSSNVSGLSQEVSAEEVSVKIPPAAPKSAPTPPQAKDSNTEFKKVTRMCFMVFLFFVISFLPFLLLNIFDAKNRAPHILHMISANFTWLNSCINPILYAAMNRHFNEAYRNVIMTVVRKFRKNA